MIHHVSIPARDPGRVARVLAELMAGRAFPFAGPLPGAHMAVSGDPLTADEAYARGLVHVVVPRERLEATARGWAQVLARYEPRAVRAMKRAVVEGIDLSLADGLALERRLARAVAAKGDA